MISSLVLIEGDNVSEEALRSRSLGNAKQILFTEQAPGFGRILHITAESATYLSQAISEFALIPDVTGVLTLAVRDHDIVD